MGPAALNTGPIHHGAGMLAYSLPTSDGERARGSLGRRLRDERDERGAAGGQLSLARCFRLKLSLPPVVSTCSGQVGTRDRRGSECGVRRRSRISRGAPDQDPVSPVPVLREQPIRIVAGETSVEMAKASADRTRLADWRGARQASTPAHRAEMWAPLKQYRSKSRSGAVGWGQARGADSDLPFSSQTRWQRDSSTSFRAAGYAL